MEILSSLLRGDLSPSARIWSALLPAILLVAYFIGGLFVYFGRVALRGLPHGAMRCYVSAPGHRSAIVDATIPSAGGLLRVELPPR